ncbi:unnamed protein product [Caenorhabditis auriculariae]|uniref:Glycosyltransferase 2-like domain-containing protein n=1 Tax=Caenorhabditis auriculariae TaxID=2777116 RepID=A0A8S1GQN6_9PELO|nr:unnamed protein product [Caenorhabditis auriculariae]
MRAFVLCLAVVSGVFCEETPAETLPKCPHIDPYTDLEGWLKLDERKCNHTTIATGISEEEKKRYDEGSKAFAFDSLASENLGPSRDIGKQAHELCEKQNYDAQLSTSVVVIHHNEALSVLLRMLNGIFAKTPANLLKEIVIYEDASDEEHQLNGHLEKYGKIKGVSDKLVIARNQYRQGLIRAKVHASRLATGEVIVFMDSHCEVADRWLEPLLQPIKENPKSVVLPVVDLINPVTFEYSKSMVAKSGFDWGLNFKWIYLPWSYFETEENHVKPFESPAMSGGLLAIRRDYFKEIGEYDMGMEIWGSENIELSLKVWLCGGRVLVAPCSRIGHVFRMRRPYTSKPGMDTALYNAVRVAKTWLGDHEKYFIKARPKGAKIMFGDISENVQLKEKLQCKDMKWFIDNVYPDLKPIVHEEL